MAHTSDADIDRALAGTPRALFQPEGTDSASGVTRAVLVPTAQTVRRLLQALRCQPGDRLLVVGGGTGYVAAAAARLVREVCVVEPDPSMAAAVRKRLSQLGLAEPRVVASESDAAASGRWDLVLVAEVVPATPRALIPWLTSRGAMVVAVGLPRTRETLIRVQADPDRGWTEETLGRIQVEPVLGQILVDRGLVDRGTVEEAAAHASRTGRKLGETLVESGQAEEADVWRALAAQHGVPFVTLAQAVPRLDPEVARSVPRAYLEHHRVVPIAIEGERAIVVQCEPGPMPSELAASLGVRDVVLSLATPTDYRRLWMAVDTGRSERPSGAPAAPAADEIDLLATDGVDARARALFDSLLLDAIGERASDIHLERYGERVRVRLRVDGDLRDVGHIQLGSDDLLAVINVLKVSARLDIAERRLPQGGRFRRRAGGLVFDLRVQTQPSLHGEHAVIRLLPQDNQLLGIEDLGFPSDLASQYRRLLDAPNGLVLVVGPTGSGKSTTLYAGLQVLARDLTRKVITAEDPIEYSIADVQQTQVRPELGFGFAQAMRAFVREDPDVVMVGEIRDGETALEAIRASQTGHIVLSTLHCNDAVDAVQRMLDLGMHPNSIASELLCVIAQRLAKRVCPHCRVRAAPPPELAGEVFPEGTPEGFRCFQGAGCAHCGGRGTHGRIAVVEWLRTGSEIRRAITRGLPADDVRAAAERAGLRSLREQALAHVQEGLIPFTELAWVLPPERMAASRAPLPTRP